MVQSNTGISRDLGASICALVFAIAFTGAAFYDADPEVYLFPQIVAAIMLVLAILQTVSTFRSMGPNSKRVNIGWKTLFPGLIIGLIFVLALEVIGFYTSSFLLFLAVVSIYGKRHFLDPKALAYKVLIGVILTAVLYGLFWNLLYVRTPTGLLF